MTEIISIPSLYLGKRGLQIASEILSDCDRKIEGGCKNFEINFESCTFLSQEAIAILCRYIKDRKIAGVDFDFRWVSCQSAVRSVVRNTGFESAFGGTSGRTGQTTSIRLREDKDSQHDDVFEYLRNEWLRPEWINLSLKLQNATLGKIWEVYTNAFEHSYSRVGVFTCGQYFKKRKKVRLVISDLGMGIPEGVRIYLRSLGEFDSLTDAESLQWALTSGHSTKNSPSTARGLGFGELSELIKINQGSLEIYSGSGYVKISAEEPFYQDLSFHLAGATFVFELNHDAQYYFFKSEASSDPLF